MSTVSVPPTSWGAHNFQPMSFNPGTGLVYIPTMKSGMRIGPAHNDDDLKNFGNDKRRYFVILGAAVEMGIMDADDGTGGLLAWDPVARQKRWEVHYADSMWNGGTLTTAGNLVFQGTGRGQFIAYDARTGDKLWSMDAGLGIIAAPSPMQSMASSTSRSWSGMAALPASVASCLITGGGSTNSRGGCSPSPWAST